jgi:thiol-disulfide isomerase/thioredoxin
MKSMFASLFVSSLILFGLSGCGSSPAESVDNGTASADDTTETPGAAADTEGETPQESATNQFERDGITAEIATWEETQEFISRQSGKIVVLDVWSTYCPPCIEEFPGLVALQKQYADQIVCISFNVNYIGLEDSPPESNSDEILDFLAKQKSQLHNIISSTSDDDVYEAGDFGPIPAVFVYGTDGELKKLFENAQKEYGEDGFTYKQHIIPLIEKLLAENAAEVSK